MSQTAITKQEQIESWVKQGIDPETATRVANAPNRKPQVLKGKLQ